MLLKGPMSEMRAAMDFTKRFGRKTGRRWIDRDVHDTNNADMQDQDEYMPRKYALIDVVEFSDKVVSHISHDTHVLPNNAGIISIPLTTISKALGRRRYDWLQIKWCR